MRANGLSESDIIAIALDGLPPPPVDLETVAHHIGVTRVLRTQCRAGFTVFNAHGPIVHISGSVSHAKSRFITAHELAHVMLRLPRVMNALGNRDYLMMLRDEERLADAIARTLLMPDAWVESMRAFSVTLTDVLLFAQQADISPQDLIRRLAASRFDLGLLQWRKARLGWAVVDRPGVSSQLHGCLVPTFVGRWALENMNLEEANLFVDCYLDDRHVAIRGTGIRKGSDVLQLVRPSRSFSAAINGTVDWFKEQLIAALALDRHGRT
jgi:hypothetical protein